MMRKCFTNLISLSKDYKTFYLIGKNQCNTFPQITLYGVSFLLSNAYTEITTMESQHSGKQFPNISGTLTKPAAEFVSAQNDII